MCKLLLAALALTVQAVPANAQPERPAETAKGMIAAGDLDGARTVVDDWLASEPRNVEALFLRGMIALGEQEYRRAIICFRGALVVEPGATRIRLELARAFYLDKDYENAFRQFQRARAGNPPEGVAHMIDRFLNAIRREKRWSYEVGIALAPDTNINNATSAREAQIFGLPFELDEEARRKSGIGLDISGRAEYSPRLATDLRLRVGVAVQRREYGSTRFDDMIIAGHAGPSTTLGRWDLSVLGTGFQRWYGGRHFQDGFGTRIEAMHYPDARSAVSFALSAQDIRNARAPLQSGPSYLAIVAGARALSPSSSASARLGINRQEARAADLASWSWFGGLGYQRDLPAGFTAQVEPGFAFSRFDAPDPFFAKRRRDKIFELQVRLLNRQIVLSRFSPRIGYTFARRRSSIDLYSFTQRRFEIGLTSAF